MSRQGTKLLLLVVSASIYLFFVLPLFISATAASVILIAALFDAMNIYKTKFEQRKTKHDVDCPSHGAALPQLIGTPSKIIAKESRTQTLKDTVSTLFDVNLKVTREAPVDHTGSAVSDVRTTLRSTIKKSSVWSKHLHNKKDDPPLDMDHVKLTFWQMTRAHLMLFPRLAACNISGYLKVGATLVLRSLNIYQPPPCDYSALVANILLESTLALYYVKILEAPAVEEQSSGLKKGRPVIAEFVIKKAALVLNDGTVSFADDLIVHIDVVEKRFIRGYVGEKSISAQDTLILVGFILTSSHHVKVHSYANWGSNTDVESIGSRNTIIEELSIITTMYNYYGYTGFPWFIHAAHAVGYLPVPVDIASVIDSGIRRGVGYHGQLVELLPYSSFVTFIMKIRGHFLNEFEKYKGVDFPEVNGEAFFVGTVLHSLDHTQLRRYVSNNFWSVSQSEDFSLMAKLFFPVLVGFTNDLPLMPVSTRFKDIKHPFFQTVYGHAVQFDKYLADHMDGCICK